MPGLLTNLQLKWFPTPLPPSGSYDDQRVVVVGATTGLGLASAVHFINLGAREVIITARNAHRGQTAKEHIEAQTNTAGQHRVKVMDVDMNRYSSIIAFVDRLKSQYSNDGGLDCVVLSAGTHNAGFVLSPEGWEEDIQVNALSKTLLGLMLLSWLASLRPQRSAPAHLVFVTSGAHLGPDITSWASYHSEGGILEQFSKEENWQGSIPNYAVSKLIAQYAVGEIAKMVLSPSGEPLVIVNSVCPGPTATDLNRSLSAASVLYRYIAPVIVMALGQNAEVGARAYAEAGLIPAEHHGKFMRKWATDQEYHRQSISNISCSQAKEVQKLVWKEICKELVSKVPAVRGILYAIPRRGP